MKLIVNADDFGFDANRTDAILECFGMGWIDRTTAMANMPDFDRAVQLAHDWGCADKVGLHIVLTEGSPLTDEMRGCRSLVDSDGNFTGLFHLSKLRRFFLNIDERRAVAVEVAAQMDRYIASGFKLMHFDSHHHSHTDPAIAKIVCAIAKAKGFRSVRISRNLMFLNGTDSGLAKRMYKWYVNHLLLKEGFEHSDWFGGFGDVVNSCKMVPEKASVEMMVHPLYGQHGALDHSKPMSDTRTPFTEVVKFIEKVRSA